MSRLRSWPRASHIKAAAEMRRHPGIWVRVTVYRSSATAKSMAWAIANGRHHQVYAPAGAFEARTEMDGDGTALIARYSGGAA